MDADRSLLPLNGPGPYRVVDGLVRTRSIELNAVDHCNLSCRACSHASPIAAESEMSPEIVFRDLATLGRVLRVENVRVVGGEPLLHSSLPAFLDAIGRSGIAEHSTLVTNGLLLDRVDPFVWELVGKVEISLYPLAEPIVRRVRAAADRIAERGVKVDVLEYDSFREAMASDESADAELVRTVYQTCQIAHFWRCITVDRGWVFRCPQSLYRARTDPTSFRADGRAIDQVGDPLQLLNFLEASEPLAACRSCLGSVGSRFPHQQIPRRKWLGSISTRAEDVLDGTHLAKLASSPHMQNGCMKRVRLEE